MMNLAEYRRSTASFADFLPWAALVDEGIVLNKDGSFQRTARFRGPDLDSAVPAELVAVAGRLNNALRRLGSGWAIFVEAQRYQSNAYPPSSCPDVASALVDAERRAQFEEEGAHFESAYFLTFLYLPPAEDAARAERWLYEGRERGQAADAHEALRGFVDRTDRVLHLVEGFMPECRWLDDGETLTYLHSCVSTKRQRVRVPETPMHLDALAGRSAADRRARAEAGRRTSAHAHHRRLPDRNHAGHPRRAQPARLSLSLVDPGDLLDKTDATKLLTRIRRQWFAKRKSIAAILKEVMTNEASALIDTDAGNKAIDADAALQELGSDLVGQAYVTATVTVWDEDPRIADERLRLVEKVIQGRDFTSMVETINAVEAWLGSLPGHVYANVRQPPISTLNLAHMIPLSAVWAGPERDEHLGAPAAVLCADGRLDAVPLLPPCRRRRPYAGRRPDRRRQVRAAGADGAAVPALSDAPRSLPSTSAGRSGPPRSPWAATGTISAVRCPTAPPNPCALQPLARIDDAAERAWAAEWIAAILAREKIDVTPEVKEHLWSALTSLASAPVGANAR